MPNKLYNEVNSNNPQAQFQTFMQNPFQFLMSRKINIPQEYQSDPHSAVQYLLNNGQMNQGAFNKLFSKLQQMGFRFN